VKKRPKGHQNGRKKRQEELLFTNDVQLQFVGIAVDQTTDKMQYFIYSQGYPSQDGMGDQNKTRGCPTTY